MTNATCSTIGTDIMFTARPRSILALAGIWMMSWTCAWAQESAALQSAAGPWDIALRDSPRKCSLVLRATPAPEGGYALSLPAGCRRALPVIKDVSSWTMTPDRHIRLTDKSGKETLTFSSEIAASLAAPGPAGETYDLTPTGSQTFLKEPQPAPGLRAAPASQVPVSASPQRAPTHAPAGPVAETTPLITTTAAVTRFSESSSQLPGRYVILRAGAEGGKDVGCMLTLETGTRAQLAPACRDTGIVIFEPVSWHFDRGRLVLTARKGHNATFDYHADGSWWKDPKDGGAPLGLRHF